MRQLKAIFPAWRNGIKSQADYDAYAGQLAAALLDRNISSIMGLQIGFKRAREIQGREAAFLPNPGTFAAWCKPHAAPCHREFKEPTPGQKQLEQRITPRSEYPERIAAMREATGLGK